MFCTTFFLFWLINHNILLDQNEKKSWRGVADSQWASSPDSFLCIVLHVYDASEALSIRIGWQRLFLADMYKNVKIEQKSVDSSHVISVDVIDANVSIPGILLHSWVLWVGVH